MFIEHAGAQLFTVSFGRADAPALVALGGWIGSWELWAEPFAPLSQSWRTIAYDHRGAGASIAAAESITLDLLVDDLLAVLDALAIESCVLAAESSGVAVALMAALREPARFTGLVLVDGLYYQRSPGGQHPLLRGLQDSYESTLDWFANECAPNPEHAAIRRWGRQILARATPEAAMRLIACQEGLDLRPQIAQIAQPALVIHGDADRIVRLADSEWLAAQLPNGTLERIPGAGHVPTMTHGDLVAAAINRAFPI
jgi:pimeloyl-ACP methyl ester carboxylesterase